MSQTLSETVVSNFFMAHGVRCTPVPRQPDERTPDFILELAQPVVCEVKQINPSKEDLQELSEALARAAGEPEAEPPIGRWMANRIRPILKNSSAQLQRASKEGTPTLLVIYDATPFQVYTHDDDIVQAIRGHLAIRVWVDDAGVTQHSVPYFAGDRGLTPHTNTSVSAIGFFRHAAEPLPLSLLLYHNPYARIALNPELFKGLPVTHVTHAQ